MDPVTLALIARGAQVAAGAGKSLFGMSQQAKGRKALASAYEAPTGKPSEYAELIAQARSSDISRRRLDEINRSMSSSTDALQRAGSRGVIGGIGAVTEAGSRAKTTALNQQQAEILRALEYNVQGGERQIGRQVARQNNERTLAQAAIQAGVQNIAGGLGDAVQGGIGFAEALGERKQSKPSPTINEAAVYEQEMKEGTIEDPNYYPTDEELIFPKIKLIGKKAKAILVNKYELFSFFFRLKSFSPNI